MKDITEGNFGVVIAFWLPGFLLLWGLSYSFPALALWLDKESATDAPSIGDFLYATIASLAVGLLISAVRWLFVDQLFFRLCGLLLSNLRRPKLDFSLLKNKDTLEAFSAAVNNHYRYYQYYSNTFISLTIVYVTYASEKKGVWFSQLTIWSLLLEVALLLASGDCIRKYHDAISQILKQ